MPIAARADHELPPPPSVGAVYVVELTVALCSTTSTSLARIVFGVVIVHVPVPVTLVAVEDTRQAAAGSIV